jgi:uncharacterized protein
MRKIIFPAVFILIFLVFLFSMFFKKNLNEPKNTVCFKERCFFVKLAQTEEEKKMGLMFKENLNPDSGMLFIFAKEGVYPFWMKNTLITLDIVWINEEKEVVFISKNTQPCLENNCRSITPDKNSKYVLEINGGILDKIGLRVGDKLIFNIK